MAPNFDPTQTLIDTAAAVERIEAKIDGRDRELFSENGHIPALHKHIGRLYRAAEKSRDDLAAQASRFEQRCLEIERAVQSSAGTAKSWRDQWSGGWWLVLALASVIGLLAAIKSLLLH